MQPRAHFLVKICRYMIERGQALIGRIGSVHNKVFEGTFPEVWCAALQSDHTCSLSLMVQRPHALSFLIPAVAPPQHATRRDAAPPSETDAK